MKKIVVLLSIILATSTFSFGSHIPGGNLTYQCTGVPNQYLLTMELFVRCPNTLGTSQNFGFTITNNCGLPNPVMPAMNIVGVQQDVTQTCASQLSNCPPNPAGGVQGILMYTYQGLITFPGPCDSWTISFNLCCRDQSTNMSGGQGNSMNFQTTINSQTQPCGGSPQVNAAPIPYVCAGQPASYCLGATDPDGDSVYYSMVSPTSSGTPIAPLAPYTIQQPLQNFILDPQTGCITFNQSTIGNFVVAILISSYDANGNLTGTVVHDYQVIVINCSNITPFPPVGGVSVLPGSNAVSTGPNSIEICEGASACFQMTFTDSNPTDSLIIDVNNSNVIANLPGAVITTSGANPLVVTICWTVPALSPSQINATITVTDGACPIQGSASQPLIINVINSTVAPPDMTICGTQTAQLSANGGTVFNWTAIAGPPIVVGTNFSCNPCSNPVASPTATTTYVVSSNLTVGCQNTDTVTVFVVPDFNSNVTQSSTTSCLFEPIQLNANVSPAAPGYTYNWTPTLYLSGTTIPNPVANITVPGTYTYTVDVTNPNGCVKTGTINITVAPVIAPTISILTPDSIIECDSTVLVDLDLGGGIPATCGPSMSNACTSPATQITIGNQTGQNTTTSWPSPFGNWYANTKHQFLFTAAELNAMGFMGGKITQIAWQVTQINGISTYLNYRMSMKCTQITNLTTWQTGLTQVLNPANYTVAVGWNNLNLTSAYEWDGVSNLVIEICYDWVAQYSYTQNCITPWTTTPFTSSLYYYSDGTLACPATATSGNSTNRPVTRFGWCPTTPDPNSFTYAWSPNVGINDSTLQNPTLSPSLPTTYTVTVTNTAGGCIDTDSITITVQCCVVPTPTVTDVTCFGGSDGKIIVTPTFVTGSEVQTLTYTDSISGAVLQVTPNVTAGLDSIVNLPAGTYTITSMDTSGCTTDTTITITQPDQMFINSITNDTTICIGGSKQIAATAIGGTGVLTLNWTDNSTATPIAGNGPHTVNPVVTPNCFSVYATDINNCNSDTQQVCISLFPPLTATTTAITDTVCEGFDTNLDIDVTGGSGAGYNYNWYQNNAFLGSGSTINVTPTSNPTTYLGVAGDNCTTPTDTIEYNVYWYAVPSLDLARNKPDSCYPITVEFTNTSTPANLVGTSLWEFSDGSTLGGNTITNTFDGAFCRDLKLTVTSINGCVSDTILLNYVCPKGYPDASFDANPEETTFLFPEISFTNNSTPTSVSSLWNFNSGQNPDSSTLTNPVFIFPDGQPGTYEVWLTVTNEHGCVDSTMRIVKITDIFLFYIPNSFTPNDDGTNDVFRAYGEGIDLSNFKMYVFDRWGEKIFETDDITDGWDGTYRGTPVVNGVYVWRIETKELFVNKRHEIMGHVNLLR